MTAKRFIRNLCLPLVLTMLLCIGLYAGASGSCPATVVIPEIEHGTVEVTGDTATTAKIVLSPDENYVTASVSLENTDVTPTEEANIFSCGIPETQSTLDVVFRRARVVLDKEELAMNSGETAEISATLSYTDDEVETRTPTAFTEIRFASSDPAVVSVDPVTGKLTALKMGYARITANAVYGNGVEDYMYVIVDGSESPVVGTIQFNAYFNESYFLQYTDPGHCFIIFHNTSGSPIEIDTHNMYHCEVPTQAYYDAVDSYDGTGIDPLTYFYATNGEARDDDNAENLAARQALAAQYFTRYERGQLSTYTIADNDIVTFGNTGALGDDEGALDMILEGDFKETLERFGKVWKLEELQKNLESGKIDIDIYLESLYDLANEVGYDLSVGYNPFNHPHTYGGVCVNHELYAQALYRDYSSAVGCKVSVTEVQLEAMIDFFQYDNYFAMAERNCTWAATRAWNLVTAETPEYHLEANRGGLTKALDLPIWIRNSLYVKSLTLSQDENIEFIKEIGVIRPLRSDCKAGIHRYSEVQTDAGITKAGTYVCADCGAEKTGTTLTTLTLQKGAHYSEGVFGSWKSSDKKVAFVSFTGTIYARNVGTSTITYKKGSEIYTCTLIVK